MVVWLASFPGSGDIIVRSLLRKAFGLEVCDLSAGNCDAKGPAANPSDAAFSPSVRQENIAADLQEPVTICATHGRNADGRKVIYVVRDPRDVIAFQIRNRRELFGGEISRRDIVLGATSEGSWADHVNDWTMREGDNALLLKYEAILSGDKSILDSVSTFLGVSPIVGARDSGDGVDKNPDLAAQLGDGGGDISLSEAERSVVAMLYGAEMKRLGYVAASDLDCGALSGEIEKLVQDYRTLKDRLTAAEISAQSLSGEHDTLRESLSKLEYALEPRLKSIITLRPLRYALAERNRLKREGAGSTPEQRVSHGARSSASEVSRPIDADHILKDVRQQAAARNIAARRFDHQDIGIAVFAHDRARNVSNVLHALKLQGAENQTHVWIDGDHGNPKKRARVDLVEECVKNFDVKQIHRNRGNFGFRKMMLLSMRYMMERYDKILFLEDDCFPVQGAVAEFGNALTEISSDDNIFSVYGHPFGVRNEAGGIARFQGWGWATTARKLKPVWTELMECYLQTEEEYLEFVSKHLTDEIECLIDVTPGRQPTETIKKFFAWDETLCLLTAMRGMRHQQTRWRTIYNFGAGAGSAHFHQIEKYRDPPFNMISLDELWDHYLPEDVIS